MAETVKSLDNIFSVSQSTFRLVLQKITAWVMVRVSYRSHRVSSFHSCNEKSTFTVNIYYMFNFVLVVFPDAGH